MARVVPDRGAVEIPDGGLQTYPDSVALRLPKAGLLLSTGNIDGAGEELSRALELVPDNPTVQCRPCQVPFPLG